MKKINIYLLCFVLTLYSCVNQKEKFLTDLNSTVDFVLQNQDNLTTKMLDVHSSKILELKNIFPIQKSKMTAKEINQVNALFIKYNDLEISINVGEFFDRLMTTVEHVSQNKDSLTTEMLKGYDYKINELRENQFPIQKNIMTAKEINQANLLFSKYNDIKNRIKIGEFITEIMNLVENVALNQDSITTKTLESYNSKIIDLRENKFLNYRTIMTLEEINQVNHYFGKYDAVIIKIHMNEIKNKLKDGLVQGSNMLNELFSE